MTRLPPLLSRLLALSLLLATVAAVYMLVVEPLQKRHAALDDSIALSQEILQRFARETADPAALEQQRDALRASRPASNGLLRGDNETLAGAYVQSFLTTTVERAGGSVRSVQVLPVREEHGLRRISARAQLHLTTTALRDVLHRLEGADPYLFVDSLDIRQAQQPRAGEEETKETELLVRFDLHGYLAGRPVAEERS